MYVNFWKIHSGRYIDDFITLTDITLGRNYPSEGYSYRWNDESQSVQVVEQIWLYISTPSAVADICVF